MTFAKTLSCVIIFPKRAKKIDLKEQKNNFNIYAGNPKEGRGRCTAMVVNVELACYHSFIHFTSNTSFLLMGDQQLTSLDCSI